MSNQVDVDEAQLRAEAADVNVGTGGASAEPGQDQPAGDQMTDAAAEVARAEAFAAGAKPVIGKLLRGALAMAAPNWTVSDAQHNDLAHNVSYALALWFPHELPPKYAALVMVGMSAYSIADANRDPKTGQILPRVKPRADATADAD